MTIKIAITDAPDVELLAHTHRACFDKAWDSTAFSEICAIAGTIAFVEEKGRGFGLLRLLGDEAEVLTLSVLPEARNQKLGSALVGAMKDWATAQGAATLFLEVNEHNKPAVKLYENKGFSVFSRRKGYYRNAAGAQEDALMMRCTLAVTNI